MRRRIIWSFAILVPVAGALAWWVHPSWLVLLLIPSGLACWATARARCAWWGDVMISFRSRSREALLTFDNAPDPIETPLVLDLLEQKKSKALFFISGDRALMHPELVKAIVERGHGIGIHGMSYDRACAWRMPGRVRSEIETCLGVVRQILPDIPVQWFRSASGCAGPWLHRVLAQHQLRLMAWSASDLTAHSRDFEKIVIRLRKDIDQGAIIALHHGMLDRRGEPLTPDLVRELLIWLPGQGYTTGT